MNFIKSIICPILNLNGFLFSYEGRIGRKLFWFLELVIVPIYAIIFRILVGFLEAAKLPFEVVAHLQFFLIAWISLAIQQKRYHDLNKSGWLELILMVLSIKTIFAGSHFQIKPMVIVAAIVFSVLIIEMGFLKGKTDGKYGTRTTLKDIFNNEGQVLKEKIAGKKYLKAFFITLIFYFVAQLYKAVLYTTLAKSW